MSRLALLAAAGVMVLLIALLPFNVRPVAAHRIRSRLRRRWLQRVSARGWRRREIGWLAKG